MIGQTESQMLGRKGERWFVSQLPDSWIFQFPTEDVGIDGVVVITEKGPPNGLEFRVQIKASKSWPLEDGHLVLRNFKRSTLRYMASSLSPAMLVLYDVATARGYLCWLLELVENPNELFAKESETVTLKIPMNDRVEPSCWNGVRGKLNQHFSGLADALSTARIADTLFATLHSLAEALRALQFVQFKPKATSLDEIQAQGLLEVVSHKEVLKSLESLHSRLEPECLAAKHIQSAITAYRSLLETFMIPAKPRHPETEKAQLYFTNPGLMNETRPRLLSIISSTLLLLTAQRIRANGP